MKELRILKMVDGVHYQFKEVGFETELSSCFNVIERLFEIDFKEEKEKWNNIIEESINHCSCFKKMIAGFDEIPLGSIFDS